MKKIALLLLVLLGTGTALSVNAQTLYQFFIERIGRFPTVAERAPLAATCSIDPYSGKSGQNQLLLACLEESEFSLLTLEPDTIGGLVTKPNTFSPGTTIRSSEINANFDTLYTLVNGNIDNANIKSAAEIDASKISGSAIVAAPSSTQNIAATTTFSGSVFVSSTNNFLAVPRLTTAQRNALIGLVNGAIVYDTTQGNVLLYEGGAWTSTTPAAATALATTVGKGIVEFSTGLEAASSSPAGSGDTDAGLVVYTGITTSSPHTPGNYIPVTNIDGKISPRFAATSSGYEYLVAASTTYTNTTTHKGLVVNSPTVAFNNVTYRLPPTQGASSSVWVNDGSGNLIASNQDWRQAAATSTAITTTTLSISSIENCTNMQLHLYVITSNDSPTLRFNNDTGSNYTWFTIDSGGALSQKSSSASLIQVANSGTTSTISTVLNIFNSPTQNKSVVGTGVYHAATFPMTFTTGAKWGNTSVAINRITIDMLSGTMSAGSSAKLFCSRD